MTATATKDQFLTLHNSLPYLDDAERTYEGYGATMERPAPKYVRSLLAWERAAQKLNMPYKAWGPKQFAAATKIYKATVVKYGFNQPGPVAQ